MFDEKEIVLKEEVKYNYNWMPIVCAKESPTGFSTLSTSKDHYSYIWKTGETKKIDYILYGHTDMVTAGEFIQENLVVTSSYDQTVKFWKI